MCGMERIYQIDQILAGRQFVPRLELQERLGVSWAAILACGGDCRVVGPKSLRGRIVAALKRAGHQCGL